jgi:predicted nucleic acid-binding protein
MRYLLDANAVIALLNDSTSPIARRIRRYASRDFGVPAVVIHELYYGAFKSQRVEKNVAGQLPPVNSFWPLTLYELPANLLYANRLNRYLINSAMLPDSRALCDTRRNCAADGTRDCAGGQST